MGEREKDGALHGTEEGFVVKPLVHFEVKKHGIRWGVVNLLLRVFLSSAAVAEVFSFLLEISFSGEERDAPISEEGEPQAEQRPGTRGAGEAEADAERWRRRRQ